MQERNTAVPDAQLTDTDSGHIVTGCRSAMCDYNLWLRLQCQILRYHARDNVSHPAKSGVIVSNRHESPCKTKRWVQGTVSTHLPISNSKLTDFNLVIDDVSNKNMRVHFERQMDFKLAQQAPTRLCSMRRQNRTAFPTSRKFWKQTVFSSAYSTMSFNWWWKNSKIPEIRREVKKSFRSQNKI